MTSERHVWVPVATSCPFSAAESDNHSLDPATFVLPSFFLLRQRLSGLRGYLPALSDLSTGPCNLAFTSNTHGHSWSPLVRSLNHCPAVLLTEESHWQPPPPASVPPRATHSIPRGWQTGLSGLGFSSAVSGSLKPLLPSWLSYSLPAWLLTGLCSFARL